MTSPRVPLSASPGISVILPVLNEQAHLEESIRAILSQKYLGTIEVILALGPSRDLTNEIAARLAAEDSRITLVDNPSGKTAAGLNRALNASTQEIVVRVDAHAEIPDNYLEIVVETLRESGAVNVGGVMGAEGITFFETAVAAAMSKSNKEIPHYYLIKNIDITKALNWLKEICKCCFALVMAT